MNPGSAIRRHGFWTLDRLRGRPVRRHHDEIRSSLASGRPNAEALAGLLRHASSTTTFYRPYRNLGISEYPLIDKATMQGDQEGFRSSAFAVNGLHRTKSSGSTGEPIVVYQNQDKRRRSIADTLVFNELAGQRLGDRLMWLFAAHLIPMSRSKQFIQNIVAVDHVGLDDTASERVVRILQYDDINAMLGINSTYQVLARYLESHGVEPGSLGLRVIIAGGENMVAEERDRISAAFGCPVVNRYSTEEHGMFATSRPGDDRLQLNRASYHFEFLKLDTDEPQVPGALARVVVTDLYNRATPIIRYDTGDLAIVGDVDPRGEAISLASVEGRHRDVVFDTSGGQVPSPSVSAIMVRAFPQVRRYQLVQEERATYRVDLVQGSVVYPEADVAAELSRWLGSDASIEVESVAQIPPLASGKQRPVVCRYDPRTEDTPRG